MKRKIEETPEETRIVRQKIHATDLKNYMQKDPIVDLLKKTNNVCIPKGGEADIPNSNTNGFSTFIMNKGCEFEEEIVKYINNYKCKVVSVGAYCEENIKKTIDLIKRGIPIIHSAPLKNNFNNTGGTADLLVRSDYLHKIVNDCPLSAEEQKIHSPKLDFPFHYVVIDIKFTTIPLRSDGRHILNTGMFPSYKAQTLIYNDALSHIQGYKSRYSYILGRRWKYNNRYGNFFSLECLDKLGVIDYQGVDKNYIKRTKDAVKWIKGINSTKVEDIKGTPPLGVYPNMCVDSGIWNKEKQVIADNIGDITNLWFCGPKNRDIALKNGIKSWRDKRCNSNTVGIKGVRAKTLNAIIKINQQNKTKILPKKIKNTLIRKSTQGAISEIYVDFETLSDIFSPFSDLPKQEKTDMIFMIGVGWDSNGVWKYKNFTCNKSTLDEEFRIMNEFMTFIKDNNVTTKFFWNADRRFWDTAERRQFDRLSADISGEDTEDRKDIISDEWKLHLNNWVDLCEIFKKEPIVIKDCFNFGLKNIANSMYKHRLISTKIESECSNGLLASVKAWQSYQNNPDPINSGVMKDIKKYNEFDCKVMWDILSYLRKNH